MLSAATGAVKELLLFFHSPFLRYNLLAMKDVLQKCCTAAHPLSGGHAVPITRPLACSPASALPLMGA